MEQQRYSISAKLFWRFIFLYLIFYIYPYGFEYIHKLTTSNISFWPDITIWFGETVLGWEFNKERLLNGFDSKYDYSRFLLIAVLALIGTGIWTLIDAKLKRSYTGRLKTLIQTILRYHVGLTLIIYGLSKVLLLQFGVMNINGLETKMGDQTGMNFLWAFMSYSKFYAIVAGLIEVIGGVLILFRKTTFMGAFILFIAMANVVLMDIGYDVRVKMFAIHLFLMTILLMSDQLKQMIRFFIMNKATVPYSFQPLFNTTKSKKIGYILKGILLLYFTVTTLESYQTRLTEQRDNRYPELASKHEVDLFIKNGDTIPNTEAYTDGWKKILINGHSYYPETFIITKNDDQKQWYNFEADTTKKIINVKPFRDTSGLKYPFNYKEISKNKFVFEGIFEGDTLRVKTSAKTKKEYPLTAKGMRWITDLE